MATALRPLSTGELLDRTFSLYRSHFGLFVGIFALPYLVVLAFQLVGLVFQSPVPSVSATLLTMAWTFGALALTVGVSAVSQAATVVAVSNFLLDRPANISDSFSKVKGQVLGVLGLSFVIVLSAWIGLFFLI